MLPLLTSNRILWTSTMMKRQTSRNSVYISGEAEGQNHSTIRASKNGRGCLAGIVREEKNVAAVV
jgi:hypothetical protein